MFEATPSDGIIIGKSKVKKISVPATNEDEAKVFGKRILARRYPGKEWELTLTEKKVNPYQSKVNRGKYYA